MKYSNETLTERNDLLIDEFIIYNYLKKCNLNFIICWVSGEVVTSTHTFATIPLGIDEHSHVFDWWFRIISCSFVRCIKLLFHSYIDGLKLKELNRRQ